MKDKKKEIHDRRKDDCSDLTRSRRMSGDDKFRRLERIERNDPMRKLPGYDVNQAKKLEDFEITHNAPAFERRNRHLGLDRPTERRVKIEVARQHKEHRKDH